MQKSYFLFSLLCLVVMFLLFTRIGYSEQYVIVDRENGDRLTGRWLNSTDTHFEIEYNGQVLRFPLEGHTLSFTSELENVPNQTAAKYYRNGRDLLDLEKPESAKRLFEKALEEFPKFVDAHYQLGLLYKADGDIQKALARFRAVLLIDAKNFDLVPLLQEIGDNAVTTEDYAQAVNAFQLILTHYPKHESIPKLTYQTGFLLMKELKDPEAALELLQKAVHQFINFTEHEEAVYQIGVLQAETGELENALNTLQRFVDIYRNSDWVDDANLKRAIIYLQLGQTKNAVNKAKRVQQNSVDPAIIAQAKEVVRSSAWNIFTHDLPDLNIQAIAVDGTSLWIGTPKGIAQIETGGNVGWQANEAAAWKINEYMPTVPDVRAIVVNATQVWVGTRNQGIIYYNKKTHEVKNYSIAQGFPSVWIRDIKMDNEEIWLATDIGVVQWILDTGELNHYHGNDPVPNDIHSIALTPEAVWVGTSGDEIAVFDRKLKLWIPKNFLDIAPETQIVRFDAVGDKMLFSWYNEETNENGFFQADWDGQNGNSNSVLSLSGTDEKTVLDDILITGVVDKTIPQLPLEDGKSESTPLVLWLAMSDYVAINYTRTQEWDGDIGYPKIVLEDSTIQCIAVDNNRIWIGTTKGMLTIDEEKVSKTTE